LTVSDLSPLAPVTLVLGGQRSGKSAYAESLIEARGPGLYLATAEARDGEMAERIRHHRQRRGNRWQTVEEPLDLLGALRRAGDDRPVLVDCLTLWLSNLLGAKRDPAAETAKLVGGLTDVKAPLVFVSNEVGGGIIPDNALARAFADAAGRMNQAVAAAADRVVLVVAGIPVAVKGTLQ
jgi:adenosylcobinamide kinase/adenosylcobinamide-phosphate guanylyltransferase